MTVEDFKDSFKYFTVIYLHPGWEHSFIEKRSSVSRRLYKFNFTITEADYSPETNQLSVLDPPEVYSSSIISKS